MKPDPFDAAIDEILASAEGDVRRALRAVLLENVVLETELRDLYAVSEHGKPANRALCISCAASGDISAKAAVADTIKGMTTGAADVAKTGFAGARDRVQGWRK